MARVVVLTPNPAIDVTYRVERQLVGETVRVQRAERRPGGKGLNVVRVLRALGVDATSVQPLGGASGDWIRGQLMSAGIASVTVPAPGATRTTVAVVDDIAHPTLLAEPGDPLDDRAWTGLEDAVRRHCEPGGYLVVAGSFPPATDASRVAAIVAAGRSAGATVVVDASGSALIAAADAGAQLLTPNESELLDATGADDLEAGIAALLAQGVDAVVVSRGSRGLLLQTADGTRRTQAAVPGISGNPTGAGDAATAGLVAALAAGLPLPAALRRAAVVGAA
ncbi:1-phosphofructokinase family hexose kinase, partial [Clavibacter lycopersici]|uniref:1-phosphofructokinase family hexose kinase n=2 Tax=Clavibacter lycopersici TaxID=2301718 RepID=UPI0011C21661